VYIVRDTTARWIEIANQTVRRIYKRQIFPLSLSHVTPNLQCSSTLNTTP
jgi:hypothetical protein